MRWMVSRRQDTVPLQPNVIDKTQTGFVKGRSINDTLFDVLDIKDHILFLFAIEALTCYLHASLPGISLTGLENRLMASYADDITLFLRNELDVSVAKVLLENFAEVSGEWPNWKKCAIISLGQHDMARLKEVAAEIPVLDGSQTERVLGVFLNENDDTDETWKVVQERGW